MTRRPDIVLLVLDTQRADRLSCYGCPQETSPSIDALASDATLFRYAFAAAQWTIPSHASMFTGTYPATHGMVQSFSLLPDALPTLAERLRDGGYWTAAFCNNPLLSFINNGLRRGFQSFLNYGGLFTSHPNQAGRRPGWFDRYRQWFKNRLVGILSQIQDAFARSETLLMLSFTPFFVPVWQTALKFKGNTPRSLKDAARFLVERRGLERDQPAFCFINLMDAHMPYRPPRRFIERFAPHVLRDQTTRRYLSQFNTDIYRWYAPLSSDIDQGRKATLDGMYNAEVAAQDEQVGRFLQTLRESGRLDQTVLIVCSDHGDHLGEKQLFGHVFSAYNELVRVPLIIRAPDGDFPRGTTVDHCISTRRLFHTLLTTAGLASEAEQHFSLAQSRTNDPDDGTVFAEAVPSQQVLSMLQRRQPHLISEHDCDQVRTAVCHGSHKLVQIGNHQPELYNIVDDPGEHLNLRDMLPEQVETLQDRLDGFLSATAASRASRVQGPEPGASPHSGGTGEGGGGVAGGADDPAVRKRLRDLGYLE